MNSAAPSPTGLAAAREAVAALLARAWLVVGLVVLGLVAGLLLAPSTDNGARYQVSVAPQALAANGSVVAVGISTPIGPQPADFLEDPVLVRVAAKTGLSYEYLTDHLTVEQPATESVFPPILLTAEADTEAEARKLLAVWLQTVREVRHKRVAGRLDRAEEALKDDLRRAVAKGTETIKAKSIVSLNTRIQTLRATLPVDFAVLRDPHPVAPKGVSTARGAVLGAIGGLIVGVVLALLIALVDGRIRTREGYEVALGLPALADLRKPQALPSVEHARESLRGERGLPGALLLVPCGDADAAEAAKKLAAGLDGVDVQATTQLGEPGLLERLGSAEAWAIAVEAGAASRREAAALSAELSGIAKPPAGLVYV